MTAHDTPRTDERAGLSEVERDEEMRRVAEGYYDGSHPHDWVRAEQDFEDVVTPSAVLNLLDRLAAAEARVAAGLALAADFDGTVGFRGAATAIRAALTGDHLPERDEGRA